MINKSWYNKLKHIFFVVVSRDKDPSFSPPNLEKVKLLASANEESYRCKKWKKYQTQNTKVKGFQRYQTSSFQKF